MQAELILCYFAAVTLAASVLHAAPRGHGGHGGPFSSISTRGGHKFSRCGSKFTRGASGTYRNWSGSNWGGHNWGGGFGYPYYWGWYPYWGWGYPYSYAYYSYHPYWYYPSYGYYYDYY